MVLKVASHHRPEPVPGLRSPFVHPPPQLLLDFLQLLRHTFRRRLAPHLEVARLGILPANMREAQKVPNRGSPPAILPRQEIGIARNRV